LTKILSKRVLSRIVILLENLDLVKVRSTLIVINKAQIESHPKHNEHPAA
jgi:hypothetical protein